MNRLTKWTVIALTCLSLLPAQDLFAALTLTTNTSSVSIPFLITDYNSSTGAAQVIKTSAQTLTILSNTSTWSLNVRALASTFSFAASLGDPNPNKPVSDLAVRVPATATTWFAFTTTNQKISSGPISITNQTRALDYRLNSNLRTDPPGAYTVTIVYTLSSP